MPTSYQSPMRGDDKTPHTHSQDTRSIQRVEKSHIHTILDHKGHEVITTSPTTSVRDVVAILRDKRIGAIVVIDPEGELVGILSERDIVRALADRPDHTLPGQVQELMTTDVQTCSPDDSSESVLTRMTEGRFRHMPVIEGGQLVGLISIGDLIHQKLLELEHEALQLKQLIVG
ncbi:Inosine-5'-monophosphate dehydrogenase [Aliiroseovarius sp. xm-m-379]|uniref:CBS domain-containing protein n=1 Tax=unclassified Aliiroseovarius TaxID=2623558 RepID=UPI001569F982|nr:MULTISPECIES: CBS domain-containing protein [unclassified Aliiroseovarius]NRP12654.1 Inosine-5'-monophosphate dehydrogenase [Aliiroseovarius sp. xm-d-517]NRP24513.1 Inosine-5'-monophosphate dehydrogenase [Aliiroseovarius sp. xm-m-379]NRP29677.1 Inosine-5'-monophosphate dehydrogenase [Aliiroseovarius sp. xm-m-314]NRP33312.1 Inosine-5'-monophosphate dehydrogenase [Aliiroseovarius sp. xm-a-104]NRP39687.1 Inosine-5'-monophosphate dehydrogenase [Aliiroseovarius sp. xm-m-339-2]